MRSTFTLFFLACVSAVAADSGLNASQLAAKMADAVDDGDSSARVRMKTSDGAVLQVLIQSRRADGRAVSVYELLWPVDRKGDKAVMRQKRGSAPEAETISASGARTTITASQMGEGIFGTDLSYADAIENFFLWPDQKIAGQENVGKVACVILESRPAGASPHGKVRSWIDVEKSVVHRVEKYDKSGRLLRTIATTQVAKDDIGRNVPAGMTVVRPDGSSTEIDGSNIRHDVELKETEVSP